MTFIRGLLTTHAPAAVVLIRLIVGAVFFSEGIQKFLFPDALGVGRFTKIGIPVPEIMAPFVGVCEVVCGVLFLLGLLTRFAAITMTINMLVAISTTKIPILLKDGFWNMAHEARTDWAMLLGRSSCSWSGRDRGPSMRCWRRSPTMEGNSQIQECGKSTTRRRKAGDFHEGSLHVDEAKRHLVVSHSSTTLGTVEVSAQSREEALTKMRNELQYRIELCPCSGASADTVVLEVRDDLR